MIGSRSGVIGMPIRLAVSFLIVALMVPPVIGTVDNIRDDICARGLSDAADELAGLVDSVGNRGMGYTLRTEFSVPDDGYLMIGGSDGWVVRVYSDDRQVGRALMDHPVTGPDFAVHGRCLLQLCSTEDGVEVTEI